MTKMAHRNRSNKLLCALFGLLLGIQGTAYARDTIDHLRFGNPDTDNIGPKFHTMVTKKSYAMSFNPARKIPNWVAWQLNDEWLGGGERSNDFRPDTNLPAGVDSATLDDYKASGYDRGHMCPSGDRTASSEENSETFLLSNMIPQEADVNRGPWEKFESWCRERVRKEGKEVYIYAGASGEKERIGSGSVAAPKYCWKVAIFLPRKGMSPADVTADTQVVALDIKNQDGVRRDRWEDYVTTVDTIEQNTKLDFFKDVPRRIQNVIEERVYGEE